MKPGDYGTIGFEPTYRLLPADAYWAAKQMAAISRGVIEAAVDSAKTPDAATRDHLVDLLDRRRISVIALAYADVTPCEVVRTEAHSVVLRDEGFVAGGRTRYEVSLVDDRGAALAEPRVIEPGVAVFTIALPLAPYVIVRVRVTRGAIRAPREVEVHLRGDRAAHRILGVRH